ncbi:hypothetical protein TRFO_42561 [Tritrichomonas foetus]|uniref:Uncharacterized protein n=1 Tax=Tritrichomonas foetus TaxID=1144522 RepID=A0A1J4KVU6_9EUKA|nr:hypothetical protein TRFO_42561 [Tritrichomonas foetus]|eukprot:OHT15351.1 hypothetical protein TRFO_42561 [Tritrichomonas foetus]
MKCDDEFHGTQFQSLYRNRKLGEPGHRLHTPGIIDPDPADNLAFGMKTPGQNSSTFECMHCEPTNATEPYKQMLDNQESRYHRSKQKLGHVPDGVAKIPPELMERGFGVSTRFSECAGDIIQKSNQGLSSNEKLQTSYQTNRHYNWRINPTTHTFGISGESQIDHVTAVMNYDLSSKVIPAAVERATHNCIVPDPDPVDPRPRTIMRTMISSQILGKQDPAERPPAGIVTKSPEFTIGDTIAGMGAMNAFDRDYEVMPRDYHHEDEVVHGLPTKPNPFPNPLRGPGKYINLGLSDEDFLALRDKEHVIPVMVQALALTEEEATNMYLVVSSRLRRPKISISEFYDYFRTTQH